MLYEYEEHQKAEMREKVEHAAGLAQPAASLAGQLLERGGVTVERVDVVLHRAVEIARALGVSYPELRSQGPQAEKDHNGPVNAGLYTMATAQHDHAYTMLQDALEVLDCVLGSLGGVPR